MNKDLGDLEGKNRSKFRKFPQKTVSPNTPVGYWGNLSISWKNIYKPCLKPLFKSASSSTPLKTTPRVKGVTVLGMRSLIIFLCKMLTGSRPDHLRRGAIVPTGESFPTKPT